MRATSSASRRASRRINTLAATRTTRMLRARPSRVCSSSPVRPRSPRTRCVRCARVPGLTSQYFGIDEDETQDIEESIMGMDSLQGLEAGARQLVRGVMQQTGIHDTASLQDALRTGALKVRLDATRPCLIARSCPTIWAAWVEPCRPPVHSRRVAHRLRLAPLSSPRHRSLGSSLPLCVSWSSYERIGACRRARASSTCARRRPRPRSWPSSRWPSVRAPHRRVAPSSRSCSRCSSSSSRPSSAPVELKGK